MNGHSQYPPLSVLVIDKTSVLESVRERWGRLSRIPNINVTLLAPEQWVENYTRMTFDGRGNYAWRAVVGKTIGTGKEASGMYVRGLRQAFRESQPDIVLMMEESFSFFALQTVLVASRYAPHAKLIFYSNNVTSYNHFTYRLEPLYRLLGRWLTPRFDVGLCVNDLAVHVLQETGHDVQIKKLFYGINERLFYPRPKEEARAALALPSSIPIFLYAGRLMELKGVQDLILAFNHVQGERPEQEMRLLVVGAGEYAQQLRSLSQQMEFRENIEFREIVPLEQMPLLMSAADVFVLPSRDEIHEQFGRVNIEAMLCGTTIIGSTSGGIPGAIGEGGYIFQAGNVQALAETLNQVLNDPDSVANKKEIGRQQALQLYSTGAFIDGLVTLFEELMGRAVSQQDESGEGYRGDEQK